MRRARLYVGIFFLLAGCASGGGGGAPQPGNIGAIPSLSISSAASASVGSNTTAIALATSSTPNFYNINSFTSPSWVGPVQFPLLQSALLLSSTSVQPDTATNAAGATIIYNPSTVDVFEFTIPSLGVTQMSGGPPLGTSQIDTFNQTKFLYAIDPFTYALPGIWIDNQTVSAFTGGFQTPPGSVPTAGSAVFRGDAFGMLFEPSTVAGISGDASVTANFGTNTLTGLFTNMVAQTGSTTGPFNDVNISAQLDRPNSGFSGSATTSTGSGNFALNGATGTVNGRFYGPNSDELGAVWTLNNATGTAVGSLGATSAPLPVITAPAAPAEGTYPAVLATANGPTFDGSSGQFPSGSFPAIGTTMQFSPAGASAATSNTNIYIVSSSASSTSITLFLGNPQNTQLFSSVPGSLAASLQGGTTGGGGNVDSLTYGLSYVSLGIWGHSDAGPFDLPQSISAIAFGYETPAAAMPTSGTADYSGAGLVRGIVLIPAGIHIEDAKLTGDASLTANFATGAITGNLTGITANDGTTTTPWNDVSVSASIASGTNKFNGSTQVTNQPSGTYVLKGSASGHVTGTFYGPNAENIGAVWTLSDGTGSAIGTVAGKR